MDVSSDRGLVFVTMGGQIAQPDIVTGRCVSFGSDYYVAAEGLIQRIDAEIDDFSG